MGTRDRLLLSALMWTDLLATMAGVAIVLFLLFRASGRLNGRVYAGAITVLVPCFVCLVWPLHRLVEQCASIRRDPPRRS